MLPSNCVYHPKFQSDRKMNSTNTNPTHNLEDTVTRFTKRGTWPVTDLFLTLGPSTFRLHLGILAALCPIVSGVWGVEAGSPAQPPHRGGYVAAPLPGVKSAKESNRSHLVNFLGGPIILWDTLNTVTGSIGFNMSTSTCLRMDLLILGFEPLLHGYPRATSWKDWLSCCNSEPPGSPLLCLLHSPAIFAGRFFRPRKGQALPNHWHCARLTTPSVDSYAEWKRHSGWKTFWELLSSPF